MADIKLDFWLTSFKRKISDESSGGGVKKSLELFDFGSNYAYFFSLIPPHGNHLRGFTDTFQPIMEGDYCLISTPYEQGRSFVVGVRMDWLTNQVGNFPADLGNIISKILSSWSNQHSLFTSRYLAFHREYQRAVNKDLLAKSYFLQFLYFLVDDLQAEILSRNTANFKELDLQRIKEVEEKITYDFKKATPSINEMAKMAGMSVSKFKNLFFELYGTTPHQYIVDRKMMYAKGLLLTGKYSITHVAYQVGYHHPSGFTRVFKQKFNHSPNSCHFEIHDDERTPFNR